MNTPTASVITLGCKVNQYESEAISERLASLGFELHAPEDVSDVYIINTCAVTAEAERKSRQLIRRARRHNTNAAVIVCGCLSQSSPTGAASIDGVAAVIGNKNKLRAADIAFDIVKNGVPASPIITVSSGDIASMRQIEEMSITSAPRTRAYVKICDGCNGRCAYCLIPSMRGPVRSRRRDSVMNEIAGLAESGVREVVLTGIETAAYGRDTKDTLTGLIRAVAEISGIERIRLGSLEPTVITPEFIKTAVETPKLVPHYHLSLQSGCSRTLAAMRRKYTADDAMKRIEMIRSALPDVMFTTDIIAGFPGETEEDFTEALDFVRRARFLMMHVFQFSPRRGTAAEKMPDQIPEEVKHDRSARLIAEGHRIRDIVIDDYMSRTSYAPVLFESDIDGMHAGHTANFIEVRTPLAGISQGEIHSVRFTFARDGVVYGETVRGKK